MNLLSATGLRREYVRAGKPFAAVNNVTFTMDRGEFVSIVGRSGSGKTTLLGMIAGLITPTAGEVRLDGLSLDGLDDAASSRLRNQVIGYVPQGTSLLPFLTALDNVRLPRFLGQGNPSGDTAERALALLEAVDAGHLRDAYPADMSGGEMRRVAIARALVNSPKLLVADEPTSDLDGRSAAEVMGLLSRANADGAALLVVTHDTEFARLAGRTLTMARGSLSPERAAA